MRYFRFFAAAVMAIVALESWAVDIIPTPLKYEKRNGVFTILTTTKITHYQGLRSSANYLAEFLPLQIREYNEPSTGNIVLTTNKNLSAEEYFLDISESGIGCSHKLLGEKHRTVDKLHIAALHFANSENTYRVGNISTTVRGDRLADLVGPFGYLRFIVNDL